MYLSRKSVEDLAGLSLPNYYPDSEVTDNISLTDQSNQDSNVSQEKVKYLSLDNLPWDSVSHSLNSITYDENILLAKKTEGIYAKPRTIRGPRPFHNFDYQKLPQFKLESDKASETTNEQQSSLEFETNTNCDEIRLNNENIQKESVDKDPILAKDITDKIKVDVHPNCQDRELKPNPIDVNTSKSEADEFSVPPNTNTKRKDDNRIKTLIEVTSDKYSEDFKSIVTVEDVTSDPLAEECKNHSHNYLKEFLESQKGSKRPLQSFLAKKFSNLTRRSSKTNLTTNQFYSLPDINVSKNLQKCEKIDRKLRKCEKLDKRPENRFIVNIGNHFDITGKTPTNPVDFQVKIAKVPKKSKKPTAKDREKEFREAVKNINNTLQTNGFCVDLNNNKSETNTVQMDPEIQEKVDNMRNYWTKMAGDECNEKSDHLKEVKEVHTPSCKIVEIHKKVDTVKKKFEPELESEDRDNSPSKIQLAKQLFEPNSPPEKGGKISPTIRETCNYFESKPNGITQSGFESLCPSAVELLDKTLTNTINEESNNKPRKTSLTKAKSINVPEFDHVRYKVIKPELFNKKILANCDSADQFEDLMKYLKDYSFQELLIDNNIVIIEPIRSKVPHHNLKSHSKSTKPSNGLARKQEDEDNDVKQGIRKHFFYQPIRVNKEVNDDELPNPEVVRQARQFFQNGVLNGTAKEQYRESSVDPDKDKCSTSSTNSTLSEVDEEEEDNMYDSLDDCCTEYVSEDILEKIREYGTTVTYYGGRVVNQHEGQPILTKVIMEEIKNNEKRCMECSGCRRRSMDKTLSEVSNEYQGLKFKLVKSNSCNSRLELVGTPNKNDSRKLNINKRNIIKANADNKCIKEVEKDKESLEITEKHAINESIKMNGQLPNQPEGEETKSPTNKYVQWNQIKKDKCNNVVQFNDKGQIIKNYDYQQKVANGKKPNDMEFEPYEVA